MKKPDDVAKLPYRRPIDSDRFSLTGRDGRPFGRTGRDGQRLFAAIGMGVIMKRVFLAFTVVLAVLNETAASAQAEPVVHTD
jgi:hypothetical protein